MALLLLLTQGMGNSPQNTERGSAPKPSIHSVPVMIIINPSFLLADMAKLHPFARAGEGAELLVPVETYPDVASCHRCSHLEASQTPRESISHSWIAMGQRDSALGWRVA